MSERSAEELAELVVVVSAKLRHLTPRERIMVLSVVLEQACDGCADDPADDWPHTCNGRRSSVMFRNYEPEHGDDCDCLFCMPWAHR